MPDELPVSIYFVWQWWEEHYQRARGRPARIDFDWLDETYLGRQRFLYEHFGEFGIGQEAPELDRAFVSKIMPFHTEIVPVCMGMKAKIKAVGGYTWEPLAEERLRRLAPVDMAQTPIAELILREREQRLARYGIATQQIDLGSPANNAFMLRGPEFYADLLADPAFARHYLEATTESICLAYRFISQVFGPMDGFPLGNCNVVMMSPAVYAEVVRPFDIRCVAYAAQYNNQPPHCDLHHCNVKTEPFAEVYSAIPGLSSLQGSYLSDIRKIHQVIPGIPFSAMVNPVDLLTKPAAQVDRDLERCLADGAHDLAIWDIDPRYGPAEMMGLLRRIQAIAARHGRRPVFSVIPITWEEMDWEFPRYRSDFVLK
jgi:hypothetical protein